MNACANRKDDLLDHAAGGPATPELERHLASCDRCRARLDGLLANAARIDETLGGWIGDAEPSAGFDDRLLRAAASRPAMRRFTGWGAALAASLLLSLMLGGLVEQRRDAADPILADPRAETMWAWKSPTRSLLSGIADPLLRTTPSVGTTYLDLNAAGRGRSAEGD